MQAAPAVDHWQALFDHTYLRWFDLNGQPALCEITEVHSRVEMVMRGGVKSRKPVVHLKQIQGKIDGIKPLVLNVTNGETISDIYGEQPSKWVGKRIVLFQAETQLGKKKNEPCIRVRAPKGEAAT